MQIVIKTTGKDVTAYTDSGAALTVIDCVTDDNSSESKLTKI